jgi:hypothetical protein
MAKSSRSPAAGPSAAWLTASERQVLDSTVGTPLAVATRSQLLAAMKKSRTLRDNWRDLFNRQTISTKRTSGGRNDPANTRSLEKSDLFAAAVRRLEARIAELDSGVAVRGTTGRTAARKPTRKPARQAGHRATRAGIRSVLAEAVATFNETARGVVEQMTGRAKPKKKSQAKKKAGTVAAKATASQSAVKAAAALEAKPAATKKKAAATTSKKARQAGTLRALAASGTGQTVHFDPKKQRSAKARATAARIKFDGLSTRRRGHTLVAGKRKQARRDGR